jgi:hypothetical protein
MRIPFDAAQELQAFQPARMDATTRTMLLQIEASGSAHRLA